MIWLLWLYLCSIFWLLFIMSAGNVERKQNNSEVVFIAIFWPLVIAYLFVSILISILYTTIRKIITKLRRRSHNGNEK